MGNSIKFFHRKEPQYITFEQLAKELEESKYAIALTGAGISAQSGIPTFRDPTDGIWKKYDPATYATIWGFWRAPEKIWEMLRDLLQEVNPLPNAGHIALSDLEEGGYIRCVITQNVDRLHQMAGSQKVIEYHGNLMSASCYQCKQQFDLTRDMFKDPTFIAHFPPKCQCGGIMKPNAVLFGERLPTLACQNATWEAERCDLLLVIGTSVATAPVSKLPYIAKKNGAKIIEINTAETVITTKLTDMVVQESANGLSTTAKLLYPNSQSVE